MASAVIVPEVEKISFDDIKNVWRLVVSALSELPGDNEPIRIIKEFAKLADAIAFLLSIWVPSGGPIPATAAPVGNLYQLGKSLTEKFTDADLPAAARYPSGVGAMMP